MGGLPGQLTAGGGCNEAQKHASRSERSGNSHSKATGLKNSFALPLGVAHAPLLQLLW